MRAGNHHDEPPVRAHRLGEHLRRLFLKRGHAVLWREVRTAESTLAEMPIGLAENGSALFTKFAAAPSRRRSPDAIRYHGGDQADDRSGETKDGFDCRQPLLHLTSIVLMGKASGVDGTRAPAPEDFRLQRRTNPEHLAAKHQVERVIRSSETLTAGLRSSRPDGFRKHPRNPRKGKN
ncbi:hypothetical protein [[Actinomadura] parvosata]